jgi:hypothetical protein
LLTGAPGRVLLATGLVAMEDKAEEVAGQTGACKTTSAAGGVGSDGSETTAANVGSKCRAGPSVASGVATLWTDESAAAATAYYGKYGTPPLTISPS